MNDYYLYGISGADQAYQVVRYDRIPAEMYSTAESKRRACRMRIDYPNIEEIYVVDQSWDLYKDYRLAVKRNSIEGWAIFKDILRTSGNRVI